MKYPLIKSFGVATLAAAIAACGGSDSGSSTGTMSLDLTDAPVDNVTEVNISITGVELQPAEGDRISFEIDNPDVRTDLNLLSLQGGAVEALLTNQELPAGEYEWMRLRLGDGSTFTVLDSEGSKTLFVPSGAQRGLQTSGFTVPAGGNVDFTIDFDVRKSLAYNPGPDRYVLRPTLRLVDNVEVGEIAGTVDSTLIATACGSDDSKPYPGSVYIFSGADETPDDIGGENEPLVAVPVDQETFGFIAAFIPAGDYTVSYTCDEDNITDESGNPIDDSLTFYGTEPGVTVEAGATTELTILNN
ncbi:protein of unknown function [Marinobacter daqiaonensis]|uniref:DUF4382 domain-containing protein n=1 Tax=Marinobacter daqiaonensis TaxID=650891 RepID=A0A1I6JWR7_9GAMM|nr:DUF4382 domain-containing protein [Marinobacter daqiaonensis]SFR83338.1 protein of unknown function [Marinobacter daqiaonensis]